MRTVQLLVALLLICSTQAEAQKLTIQGDKFAVDGVPKFLTFLSYFGAMGAPNIQTDFRYLKKVGFDGVRIWPNLDTGPQLIRPDASLDPTQLARLRFILDQAKLEGLVVDVTFTHEHTAGLGPSGAQVAITATADALRSYDHILFDIQNERNVGDRRFMSEDDVLRIFRAVKATDPNRITTASNSPADQPPYAADFTARLGLDVTAYHEPRTSVWHTLGQADGVMAVLRTNGRPAYLQEPMTTRDDLYSYPAPADRAEYFLKARAHYKLAGAAAWCFHSDVGIDFRSGPPFVEDRFREYPEPEQTFVQTLRERFVLRTGNGRNVVVAEGGGGAGVRADRTVASPGSWDMVTVVTLTGGALAHGDRVALMTADGRHYLQAASGGGGALTASSTSIGLWETFTIERVNGSGLIRNGDTVALRAGDSAWYVRADGGGGGSVSANSPGRGGWETFTALFVPPYLQCAGDATPDCR